MARQSRFRPADRAIAAHPCDQITLQAIMLGGDKGFGAADFVTELREINVTPHIARNTTRHPGYVASQRIRKRIEESFGRMKTIAGLRKTKYRGLEKVRRAFPLAAYNLIRLPKLMAAR